MNPSDDRREGMGGRPLRRREMLKLAAGASVAALLAACGGSTATDTPKPASTTAASVATAPAATTSAATGNLTASKSGFKGTLQYWVLAYLPNGGNATGKLMDAAVANFTKANPDIKVEVTGYTGDQAGFTKLTQAV